MRKYLHRYESLSAFTADYEDSMSAPTVSFVCSAGTFTYDSYDENIQAYVWINQAKELWTPVRNPGVGLPDWDAGTGAYDPDNDNDVEITQVNQEAREPKYIEPWVSATANDYTESIHVADIMAYGSSSRQDADLIFEGVVDYEISDIS